MLDIKAILKANGIEGEAVSTIADAIKLEIPKDFVAKTQYNKKIAAIEDLNVTIADLQAKAEIQNTDEYKTKYEALETEFNDFKQNIETEKVNSTKTDLLRKKLQTEGVNEKVIKLLEKEFDLNTLEVENDDIKDWDNLINPVKENYSDFFKVTETIQGNPPNTPPPTLPVVGMLTREQINNMSASEINANWETVSKSLGNLK